MRSLREQAANGAKWTAGSASITSAFQFLQLAVLARLLRPEDFGLMAMVMVVVGFAQVYADLGISAAVIQRQQISATQLSSLFWFNILAGILLFGIINSFIPLIVKFYNEPRLRELIFWTSFVFLITPWGQQFYVLLQRQLRFKEISVITSFAAFVGTFVAIMLALSERGVFSLIWGQLATATVRAVLLIRVGLKQWRPRFCLTLGGMRWFIQFGLYQMGERTINYFNSNVDQLLIGTLLGAKVLGYYNLAYNLVIRPVAKINPILTRVAFPVFAKVQSNDLRLKRGYFILLRALAMVNFPILLGVAAVAPSLLPVVFGNAWSEAIGLVQILAFVALLRSTDNPQGSLILAKGRADLGFHWNLLLLCIQIPCVYLGAWWGGGMGTATALLFLQCFYFFLGYYLIIQHLLGPSLSDYIENLLPPFAISGTMMFFMWIIGVLYGTESFATLAIQLVGGSLLYLILSLVFQRPQLREMRMALRA